MKVKNPPFSKQYPHLSPTPPFLGKLFHTHAYCQIRGSQSPPLSFIKGAGGVVRLNYGGRS